MAIVSETSICNMALAEIGNASQITSLLEASPAARICRMMYPMARNEVLVMVPWKCATARAVLARLAAVPVFGYDYAYQLPVSPKCLHVREVILDHPSLRYSIEGDKLLTDSASARIVYTSELTDTTRMSVELVRLIVVQLAIKLFKPLGPNDQLKAQIEANMNNVLLPQARGLNGEQAQVMEDAGQDYWIDR